MVALGLLAWGVTLVSYMVADSVTTVSLPPSLDHLEYHCATINNITDAGIMILDNRHDNDKLGSTAADRKNAEHHGLPETEFATAAINTGSSSC